VFEAKAERKMAMTLLVEGNLMLTGNFGFLIGLIAEKLQLHACFWTCISKPLEILPPSDCSIGNIGQRITQPALIKTFLLHV
jgi:hypothetical protein